MTALDPSVTEALLGDPSAPIYVTRPDLPPLEDVLPLLEQIWETRVLTNGGPYHRSFETALADHLGVPYVSVFSSGTAALVAALHALGVKGEVVTTPYTFVATAHSLLWTENVPVFADVDPVTLDLDPDRAAEAITERTSAILPVHCYGGACDVAALDDVAGAHAVPVIYDAAHAFGVQDANGRSLLSHGDLSVLSFHATKVFTTFEGGAIVSHSPEMKRHIANLRNFGFRDETTVVEVGVNGKMNELQAAIGLLQLERTAGQQALRRHVDQLYRDLLADVGGIRTMPDLGPARSNHSYFPVFVEDEFRCSRDALYHRLREHEVYARRYFYPLVSSFPMYRDLPSAAPSNLPHATDAAERVLCLPIYASLAEADVERIVSIIRG